MLKENKWYYYDPDKSPRGLEYRYRKIGRGMQIEIPGTNSFWDWLVNIFGAFFTKKLRGCRVHKLWYYIAFRFFRVIKPIIHENKINHITFRGHSLGGAIAVLTCGFFSWRISIEYGCFGAPNCGLPYTTFMNRGDIVPHLPFWLDHSKKIKQGKWQPFWKAHLSYDWRFE